MHINYRKQEMVITKQESPMMEFNSNEEERRVTYPGLIHAIDRLLQGHDDLALQDEPYDGLILSMNHPNYCTWT